MKSDEIITKIQNKLKESTAENRTVTDIFQFIFTDSEGKCIKKMVFDFKDLNIYEGTISTPDAEITISDEDFFSIGTHEATFGELISSEKVHTKGDKEAINKMIEKFRMNQKK